MPFPETTAELEAAGYKFLNDANCSGCGAAIQWWQTPKGKRMPMDVDLDGNCESHFSTCPKSKDFRK